MSGDAKAADARIIAAGGAKALAEAAALDRLTEWGAVPTMIAGRSATSGVLLHRNPDGSAECGVWECTPGRWACRVERDEFCQFIAGVATYTSADGATLDIRAGTLAFFPAGWEGECDVRETVRKSYMIA